MILFQEKDRTITLETAQSTYQMKIDELGTLVHTYYGRKTEPEDLSYLLYRKADSHVANPYEIGYKTREYSLNSLPQEISGFGTGDYRVTALRTRLWNGAQVLTLRYQSHEILSGKYGIEGLPAAYGPKDQSETLVVHLMDPESEVKVALYYGVFADSDVITRALTIENGGKTPVTLEKAASMTLDFPAGEYDLLTFPGKWAKERSLQRGHLQEGVFSVGSVRGSSSSRYNPTAVLCSSETTETQGDAWGLAFVYSGNFLLEAEKSEFGQTRLNLGIHPDNFSWTLQPGEIFYTPEAALGYSSCGFAGLTHAFHSFTENHIVRGPWQKNYRPVLINNWEGTYFDFTGEKLLKMAREARDLGIEMFVLDDGWFGKRDNDKSSLGDWIPNEKKLGCSLKELGDQIRELGLKFGIWFEPETISEDSDLFRRHPDWAVKVPGRAPALCRNELILDMTRPEVRDYLVDVISRVLRDSSASYMKWDFNRNLTDAFTQTLPAERQGEFEHRFILGTYQVLDRLLKAFPELLIEGCSAGGGRFDLGMLYYTPQIWTSDDTDAVERLTIQYGTSFFYPVRTMGAHVSAVPNHQTGRKTPLATRGAVAGAGSFGYELDPEKLSETEKEEIRYQIREFKAHYETIHGGIYERLTGPDEPVVAWEIAAQDGKEVLVTAVYQRVEPNRYPRRLLLRDLEEKARYRICLLQDGKELDDQEKQIYGGDLSLLGSSLMYQGLNIPGPREDYQAWIILLTRT